MIELARITVCVCVCVVCVCVCVCARARALTPQKYHRQRRTGRALSVPLRAIRFS